MLARVLEPEVMDTPQEALVYDVMDHTEVNRLFVSDLLSGADLLDGEATGPASSASTDADLRRGSATLRGEVLDLGTGTARIPIELCRRNHHVHVVAVDLSQSMLDVARRNVAAEDLARRVVLERVDGKRLPYQDGRFAAVMSNSIIHHIPDPHPVLAEAVRVVAAGGLIFFRDLLRPPDEATWKELVQTYAGNESDYAQQMFADSLRAALTLDEMRELVQRLGMDPRAVRATSDRHWTWNTRKPESVSTYSSGDM